MSNQTFSEKELKKALEILQLSKKFIINQKSLDLRKVELRAKRIWHPDNAISRKLGEAEIDRFTRNFQEIPKCSKILERFLQTRDTVKDEKQPDGLKSANFDDALIQKTIREKIKEYQNQPDKTRNHKKEYLDQRKKIMESPVIDLKFKSFFYLSRYRSYFAKAFLIRDWEYMARLVNCGLDINGTQYWCPLKKAIANNDEKMVQFLLNLGTNPNSSNKWGTYKLALDIGNFNIITMLIRAGADFEELRFDKPAYGSRTRYGRQKFYQESFLIFELIRHYGLPLLRLFVENGIPINVRDNKYRTPLMVAIKLNRYDIVEYLLQNGADPALKNKEGLSASQLAEQGRNPDLVDLINRFQK